MNKNIVLTGFMGAGKSLIAKQLSEMLGRDIVSTDELIVESEGRLIVDIFKDSGEAHFRKVEKDVVADVSERQDLIVDCGGGVVLDSDNIAHLKEKGAVFYLMASPEEIYARIKHETHRPLLNIEDPEGKIRDLLSIRRPFYEKADYQIDTNGKTADQICQEIVEIIS